MGKPQKRNAVLEQMAVELYNSGMSGNAIAKKLDVAPRTAYRMLHDAGISIPGWKDEKPSRRKFSAEVEALVVADYMTGMSLSDLEAKYGSGQFAIRSAVKRSGHKLRDHGAQRRRVADGEIQEIVRLYVEEGLSQGQVAVKLGCHQTVVSNVLRSRGVHSRNGASTRISHNWNGGIAITGNGYLLEMADRNGPFGSMVTRSGYVMQHRLVMARSLGRPLLATESVHHINGDRTDNRIENLQLRQGKHGKGTVMCCADCGSERITHKEIA